MWNTTSVSQSARTHGLGWRTAHASSIDEKGVIYIFKATSARLVRVLLVKENPYPDYNFIEHDLLLKQKQSLEQHAEYGEINHDLMKEIYENIFDKDLIKKKRWEDTP